MNVKNESTQSDTTSTQTNSGYNSDATPAPTNGTETQTSTGDESTSSTTDEFGYEQASSEPESLPTPPAPESKAEKGENKEDKTSEEEVETKATGYGDEPPKPPAKEEETKTNDDESKDDVEKIKQEITETVKNLPEGYSQEKLVDFAMKNGLTNDQVKAYVEMESAANADAVKAREAAIAKQRADWHQELKDDVNFGGENFDQSVKRAEQILEKHFPNLKKVLTERGGMVPPYIMKDFLKLHQTLNPTAPLVNGEPMTPKTEDDGNFLDDMYQ